MATAVRKSGIGVVGDITWGTHFCHFYETKDDLLDTLVSYFKAGLESDEFCVWVVPEPLTEHEAWSALRQAVPVVLAENLSRLVPTDQVMVFPWGRAFAPDAQVIVDISRLEGKVGADSVLAARWRILGRSGEEVTMGVARLTEPSGSDYESLVAAQSRLVGALSRDIAAALRSGVQASTR